MSNYYETLKILPTATELEIQDAYDVAYNHWRKLVTHHDPNIANQANQALQVLEQIRSVLVDPTARSQYDVKINAGSVGGLSDPFAQSNLPLLVVPPMVKKDRPAQSSTIQMQSWICPSLQCNTPNRVGTKFCAKCGTQTARNCPQCGSLIEIVVEFCTECGANVKQLDREQRIKLEQEKTELVRMAEEAERDRIFSERTEQEKKRKMLAMHEARERRNNKFLAFLLIIFIFIFIYGLIWAFSNS